MYSISLKIIIYSFFEALFCSLKVFISCVPCSPFLFGFVVLEVFFNLLKSKALNKWPVTAACVQLMGFTDANRAFPPEMRVNVQVCEGLLSELVQFLLTLSLEGVRV